MTVKALTRKDLHLDDGTTDFNLKDIEHLLVAGDIICDKDCNNEWVIGEDICRLEFVCVNRIVVTRDLLEVGKCYLGPQAEEAARCAKHGDTIHGLTKTNERVDLVIGEGLRNFNFDEWLKLTFVRLVDDLADTAKLTRDDLFEGYTFGVDEVDEILPLLCQVDVVNLATGNQDGKKIQLGTDYVLNIDWFKAKPQNHSYEIIHLWNQAESGSVIKDCLGKAANQIAALEEDLSTQQVDNVRLQNEVDAYASKLESLQKENANLHLINQKQSDEIKAAYGIARNLNKAVASCLEGDK